MSFMEKTDYSSMDTSFKAKYFFNSFFIYFTIQFYHFLFEFAL